MRINRVILAALILTLLPMTGRAGTASANMPVPVQETASGEAQSVITDQLEAFKSGDTARAYSHAAPNIKRVFPDEQRFMQMVTTGYPMVNDPAGYRFGRAVETGGMLHQEVFITDRAGKTWQAVYMLQRQPDGSLKITGVKIEPSKGVGV